MKGQKGSMGTATQRKFEGCENCSTGACFGCHHGRDAYSELEQLPPVHSTKFRWNTGK